MQSLPNCAPNGGNASRLTYAVEIKPKGFLPVKLIEGRIATDLKANLAAIRDFVESIRGSEWDGLDGHGGEGKGDSDKCVLGGKVIEGIIHLVENGGPHIELEVAHVENDENDEDSPISTIATKAGKEQEKDTVIPVTHSSAATTLDAISHSQNPVEQQHDAATSSNTDRIITSMSSSNILSISEADRRQLAFENEDIQRLVAVLERDLGSALQKIREIGALSSSTLLHTEAA